MHHTQVLLICLIHILPIFKGLFKNLIVEEFESTTYATTVEVSPLIIASIDDKTIPYHLSEKLSNSFSNIYDFIVLEDVDHNGFLEREEVIENIISYIHS